MYKTKAKNAQEAHEAIRPTDFRRQPDKLKGLSAEEARLYKLIWQRAVASQMASADFERTTVEISTQGSDGHPYGLRATGSVVLFDGFLKLYEEGRDDAEDEDASRLPKLERGQQLRETGVEATQHFTEPPPRFTEATLIREMERLGIGRPSTYASTMSLLREREYVKLEKKRLQPEDKGRLVTTFLEAFFKRYVEYDFTAYLEDRLDQVSDGKLDWKELLRDFWRDFLTAVNDIKDLRVTQVLDALNELLGPHIFPPKEDGADPRLCPLCAKGQLSLKMGRNGAFVGCSNYPECRFTRQLKTGEGEGEAPASTTPRTDPETGLRCSLKTDATAPISSLAKAGTAKSPKTPRSPPGMEPGIGEPRICAQAADASARGGRSSRERRDHLRWLWALRPLYQARSQIRQNRCRGGSDRRTQSRGELDRGSQVRRQRPRGRYGWPGQEPREPSRAWR